MSLKSFHIFFMTAAAVIAAGFGIWCLQHEQFRAYAVPALVVACLLPIYGVWFIRKMRRISNGKAI